MALPQILALKALSDNLRYILPIVGILGAAFLIYRFGKSQSVNIDEESIEDAIGSVKDAAESQGFVPEMSVSEARTFAKEIHDNIDGAGSGDLDRLISEMLDMPKGDLILIWNAWELNYEGKAGKYGKFFGVWGNLKQSIAAEISCDTDGSYISISAGGCSNLQRLLQRFEDLNL